MSRIKNLIASNNFSIISQLFKNYSELLSPPSIDYPIEEAITRTSFSDVPDGSEYSETLSTPIGESFEKAAFRLSKEANIAWKEWIALLDNPKLDLLSDYSNNLEGATEKLFLTDQEQNHYTRTRRLKIVDDASYRKRESAIAERIIEETFTNTKEINPGECENRFYYRNHLLTDRFGQETLQKLKLDRCLGKAQVKGIQGIQVSDIERSNYSLTLKEKRYFLTLTRYQTEVWRESYSSGTDKKYLPNISMMDDPDFIPPISISSRNFVEYPPASRSYNITFKVMLSNGQQKLLYPDYKIKKDYTSLSSIKYILDQKEVKYDSISVHEVEGPSGSFPLCSFEVDIRVTYCDNCLPDPLNYKKVDPSTNLGRKLVQVLNEQPYLWKEHVWDYEDIQSDGSVTTTKKLAVAYPLHNPKDSIGPRVYWVYINDKSGTIGRPSFLKTKLVAPQTTYYPMQYFKPSFPNYTKVANPFLASIRVSNNYSYFNKKLERYINFNEVEKNFINHMSSKGYLLYNKSRENNYNNISLYKFIHQSTKTRDQRKSLFLKLNSLKPNDK